MANVTATVSRGSTSVDIPILGRGGELGVARDVGKPTSSVHGIGREDPRHQDFFNASDAFTITGLLHGTNAYSDAQTLAESLIKPRATTGTPLQLDLSDLPNRGTYDVAPTTGGALSLTYVPGRRNLVGVNMTLNVVAETIGGDQTQTSTISPDSGDGIKLVRDSTSQVFDVDESVTREVGRPEAKLQPRPDTHPTLHDRNNPAEDIFELNATLVSSTADADSNTLEETIVRDLLGQSTLRLHFLGNLFGLDAYDVVPVGSQALRTAYSTGRTGWVDVPKLRLRVVNNP